MNSKADTTPVGGLADFTAPILPPSCGGTEEFTEMLKEDLLALADDDFWARIWGLVWAKVRPVFLEEGQHRTTAVVTEARQALITAMSHAEKIGTVFLEYKYHLMHAPNSMYSRTLTKPLVDLALYWVRLTPLLTTDVGEGLAKKCSIEFLLNLAQNEVLVKGSVLEKIGHHPHPDALQFLTMLILEQHPNEDEPTPAFADVKFSGLIWDHIRYVSEALQNTSHDGIRYEILGLRASSSDVLELWRKHMVYGPVNRE